MPRTWVPWLCLVILATLAAAKAAPPPMRRLPVSVYRDRVMAGWLGQMVGVAWGEPLEFRYTNLIPEERVPAWTPETINNCFVQDDVNVELTFLHTLDTRGWEVSPHQVGLDFANTMFGTWGGNRPARDNLRLGIAPPDCSHPRYHPDTDTLDCQIESDYSGLIAPGLPNTSVQLGEKFGRLVAYGDGLYAGQFVGAMYAEAFFETDPEKIVRAALRAIPAASQYAEMVRDVLAWHRAAPYDWPATYRRIEAKYMGNPQYLRVTPNGINCKVNGAFVLMGLLYGERDIAKTTTIAMRGARDADCNASTAAGVLFATLGLAQIPDIYWRALDRTRVFLHTPYTFPDLEALCERLARQAVTHAGGRIERDAAGEEVFVIPVQPPAPSRLMRSWDPEPPTGSRFTAEELAQITVPGKVVTQQLFPGWVAAGYQWGYEPVLWSDIYGRKQAIVTVQGTGEPVVFTTRTLIPPTPHPMLRLTVGRAPGFGGWWTLAVRVDGKQILLAPINPLSSPHIWTEFSVDLSAYAGQTVRLAVEGWRPDLLADPQAYWAEIRVTPGPETAHTEAAFAWDRTDDWNVLPLWALQAMPMSRDYATLGASRRVSPVWQAPAA